MAKQVSLSHKAEISLEDIIQNETKGEAIYFWTRLDTDLGLSESNSLISFWSTCDVLNGGYCRYEIEFYCTLSSNIYQTFNYLYAIKCLPPRLFIGARMYSTFPLQK